MSYRDSRFAFDPSTLARCQHAWVSLYSNDHFSCPIRLRQKIEDLRGWRRRRVRQKNKTSVPWLRSPAQQAATSQKWSCCNSIFHYPQRSAVPAWIASPYRESIGSRKPKSRKRTNECTRPCLSVMIIMFQATDRLLHEQICMALRSHISAQGGRKTLEAEPSCGLSSPLQLPSLAQSIGGTAIMYARVHTPLPLSTCSNCMYAHSLMG